MELKKPAVAGTLESSDVQITLRPNPGQGIQIELQSGGRQRQGSPGLCHPGPDGVRRLPRGTGAVQLGEGGSKWLRRN